MSYKYALGFFAIVSALFFVTGCDRSKRAEVKKEKIGDVELAYYTRGSGDPLVMIMGFRGTMAVWDPALLEALEKKYTLILFDNRGVGFSSDTEDDLTTIPQMAQDTAQLIKALGYEKTHILGWSMGSRIALDIAMNHPDVVDHLILCSPNPGGTHQEPRKSNSYQRLTAEKLSEEEALSLLFPTTSAGRSAGEAFIGRLRRAIILGSVPEDLNILPQTIHRQVNALKLWDENETVYGKLSSIQKPTLVAGGLSDIIDQTENVGIIASQIPFAWTAYFAGAGHAFLSQDYKNFADLVTLFIESTGHENR